VSKPYRRWRKSSFGVCCKGRFWRRGNTSGRESLTLKFLVDECTGKRFSILLENAGYDVIFAGDWKTSASDDEVLEKAEEEGRALITDDKNSVELVFRLRRLSESVILLRTSTTNPVRMESSEEASWNFSIIYRVSAQNSQTPHPPLPALSTLTRAP